MSDPRKQAERAVSLARLWARARQVLTTDPTGSDEDDRVVDEEAARVLAAQAGRLKGGLAKVAQLAAYDPARGVSAVLGALWDRAPAASASEVAGVVEAELGMPPQRAFAEWNPVPLAAASLGQVHAARLDDGTDVVVKVQYAAVADALRADLDDVSFVRKLAGTAVGQSLDDAALGVLAAAVRRELDYRAEAAAGIRFAAAWADDPVLRVPRVIEARSTSRVLTMTRARGRTVVDVAGGGTPDVRRMAAIGIYKFAWGSPLAHGLLNADPNPGNFLVDEAADGHVHVWCLDFGCCAELEPDRALWWGLVDDDSVAGTERFRLALAQTGLLRRADALATTAHRDWERALAAPLVTRGEFHWTAAYARELATTTGRVLRAGGLQLPAHQLLLWRQRLGASTVIGMLDAHLPVRRVLVDLIGTGKHALGAGPA